MARLLIASNRLPVTVKTGPDGVCVEPSTGGLATGMRGPHERLGGLWIGWPGDLEGVPRERRDEIDRSLARLRLLPVPLSVEEVARYYEGYANAVLWPLFHYAVSRLPDEIEHLDAYESVNEKFADAIASSYEPGDLVWVHDYQLMRVPALLRERVPEARIGFFLHIPFPSSEIFRSLPHRERLLEGLLGADLVGFHTAAYVRHFASSALRLLGATTEVDRLRWRGREIRIGAFPMGVDAAAFDALARKDEVLAHAAEHRFGDARLVLGVDRLDYTKGIPQRLLAFDALLRRHPELRGHVRLVQVAVPSRENVGAYRDLRAEVDALVGRIHGEFATPTWSPIHYLYRALSRDELVALYRAADVLAVTPLRDGMNLVAKEFVASRPDGDGVLVLSELAGAAAEMSEALVVNPYDVDATAEALRRALEMPADERRTRMGLLRERVASHDVHWWARAFVAALERIPAASSRGTAPSPRHAVEAALAQGRDAPHLALLLDYDGTLVPFAPRPELAAPDRALIELLTALAARPDTEVHVVSGRRRAGLERWLGALPVGLHAEHGLWTRFPGEPWTSADGGTPEWREPVLAILRDFADRTPGSLVEEKTAGAAWHYRSADPDLGPAQAKELSLHLATLLANVPVEILPGDAVIEVRPHGINKGRAVGQILSRAPPGTLLIAMGDDRTDEDMFAALTPGHLAVHVGPAPSRALLRLAGVREARAFLAAIAARRPIIASAEPPAAPPA